MEKSCANHPESMALATCKACGKSVCLMCVVDEKEGTFCSTNCHEAHVAGEAVPAYVDAPASAQAAPESSAGQKLESIFDSEPSAPSEGGYPPPQEADSMPIVAEGTKWRPIGAQCTNHGDTPAVATCDRCARPVCALCLLEASSGTFCSSDCMEQNQLEPAPQESSPVADRPIPPVPKRQAPVQQHAPSRPRKKGGAGKLVVSVGVILLLLGGGLFAWKSVDPAGCAAFLRKVPAMEGLAKWAEGETPDPIPPKPPVVVNPDPVKPPVKPDPVKPDPVKPDPVKPPVKPDPVKPDPVKPDPVKPDPVKPPVKPDPVKPPVKPVRPEAPKPTRMLNPWAEREPGLWYRTRTESGGQVSYTDYGLKEKGTTFYVLRVQTSKNGQAGAVQDVRTEVQPVVLEGEQNLSVDGRGFMCEVRSSGPARKSWVLVQGRNAGAVLKEDQPDGTLTAQRVWDHPLRIKGDVFDCLVVEAQFASGNTKHLVKTWYTSEVPLGMIKQERPGSSVSVVDMGGDWSKRPPFPKD